MTNEEIEAKLREAMKADYLYAELNKVRPRTRYDPGWHDMIEGNLREFVAENADLYKTTEKPKKGWHDDNREMFR